MFPAGAALALPLAYHYNILVSSVISLQVIATGFQVSALRRKYKIPYPDMGTGRHSSKLTDAQWEEFNNYQRAHYNYVEGVASALTLQLLGGLYFPKTQAILGVLYVFGRALYSYGYQTKGPNGRSPGVLLLDLALIAEFGVVVYGAVKALGYF